MKVIFSKQIWTKLPLSENKLNDNALIMSLLFTNNIEGGNLDSDGKFERKTSKKFLQAKESY